MALTLLCKWGTFIRLCREAGVAKLKKAHKPVAMRARRKLREPSLEEQLFAEIASPDCDEDTALKLVENGASPHAVNEEGTPLILLAARKGLTDVVDAMLKKGADANAADDRGQNALIVASYKGYAEMAASLLSHGADPNLAPCTDDMPLYLAASYEQTAIVRHLLTHGAAVDVKTSYGTTALSRASFEGQDEIVQMLLEKGANVDNRDNHGQTPLMMVAMRQRRDLVGPSKKLINIARMLLEAGAETRAVCDKDLNALQLTESSKQVEIRQMIAETCEKNDRRDLEQGIPLRKAIKVCSPIKLKFGG